MQKSGSRRSLIPRNNKIRSQLWQRKKKEEVTTEIAVAVELPAQVITENGEDQSLIEIIELPGYEDLNDSKVLGNVKEVFRDFDYDVTENMGKKFEDTKALAQYVEHSMEDIRTIRSRAEASELTARSQYGQILVYW